MKRLICLVLTLVLCLSVAAPVLAEDFVPSIGEKDGPALVPFKDPDGKTVYGRILDANGNPIGYLDEDCIVVTPISKVAESELIPDAAEALLVDVYKKLKSGEMQLPYEKFSASLKSKDMVIRELVDASWLCIEHPDVVAPKGVHVELTFDLGVGAKDKVYVMSYKHEAWNPIVETVNNGDGTVTCTFEDFCPISFSIAKDAGTTPPKTGDNTNLTLWVVLMVVAAAGLTAVVIFGRKGARKNS